MSTRARRIPPAATLQREAVMVLGGLRALLLQLAHPAVGHGVADHSRFAENPLGRLRATLAYVYAVAADDPQLTEQVAGRIDRMHAHVRSAPGAAIAYDARDPDLQWWVAATIHDTAVRMAELVWGPLPAPLAMELLRRNGRIGTALGMPPEQWPADPEAFHARFDAELRTLRFDSATTAVVRELLAARAAPSWARRTMPAVAAFTAPLLPPTLAAQIGLLPTTGSRIAVAVVRATAPLYRALPRSIRTLPAQRLTASARRPGHVGAQK